MKANGPGQSALLLLDIIPLLERNKIPYAIIGAFAASFHGIVRASLDTDAIISVKKEDIPQLLKDFQQLGLNVSHNRGDIGDPVEAVINIEDPFFNRVDFLLGIRGMDEGIFQRALSVEFMESNVKVVGLEDFIAMKVFAGNPKDIQDVIGALEISSQKIDLPLLKNLTIKYGKDELEKLKELLNQ